MKLTAKKKITQKKQSKREKKQQKKQQKQQRKLRREARELEDIDEKIRRLEEEVREHLRKAQRASDNFDRIVESIRVRRHRVKKYINYTLPRDISRANLREALTNILQEGVYYTIRLNDEIFRIAGVFSYYQIDNLVGLIFMHLNLYDQNVITLKFTEIANINNPIDVVYDNINNVNCFINIMIAIFPNEEINLRKYNTSLHNGGATQRNREAIAEICCCNYVLYDRLGKVQEVFERYKKKKVVNIVVEGEHAILTLTDAIKNPWRGDIKYVSNLLEQYSNDDNVKRILYTKSKLLSYTDGTLIYRDINAFPTPEQDEDVISRGSYYFKKFVKNNKLQDIRDPKIREFITLSIHHPVPIAFTENQDEIIYGADHNQNHSSFSLYRKFKNYGLPLNEPIDWYEGEAIDKTGWGLIENVDLTNTHPYIQMTKFLRNNNTYTTLVLKVLREMGAKFDIVQTMWSERSANIWLPDIYESDYKRKKDANNHTFGRLVMGEGELYEGVKCKTKEEFNRIIHSLWGTVCDVNHKHNEVIYQKKCNPPKQYPHVYSYIIAYSMLHILDKIVQIPIEDLLKVKVDAIYLRKWHTIFEIGDKRGEWKQEQYKRVNDEVFKSQYLQTFKDQPNTYTPTPPLQLLPQHLAVMGNPGTGKTHLFLGINKLINTTVTAISIEHTKRISTKYGVKGVHIHKLFNIQCQGNNDRISNLIIDEAWMLSDKIMCKILKDPRMKYARIISTVGMNQLPPILGVGEKDISAYLNKIKKITLEGDKRSSGKLTILQKKYEVSEVDYNDFNCANLKDLKELYKHGDVIIGSTHAPNDKLNKYFVDKIKPIPVIFKKGQDNYVKGERAYVNEVTNNHKLAYANTIHVFQGETVYNPNKLFILMDNLFQKKMFYVAITRVECWEQIVLIRDF